MSPKQTKRSPPASPVRRSRRVARRPPEVDPQQWPGLHDRAKDRVRNYVSASASENKNDGKLISCLIAFLEWLPEGGRESLARDLVECDDDTDVYDIFDNFRTGLVYAMKPSSRRSSVASPPSDKRRQNVETVAASLPLPSARSAGFRETCLRRDSYQCIVSGRMDTNHWDELGQPEDVGHTDLEAAHIIPFTYASWKAGSGSGTSKNASSAWEVLYRCFPRVRKVGMSVNNINDMSNGITLSASIHTQFDKFRLAFVATDEQHSYSLKTYPRFETPGLSELPPDRMVRMRAAAGAEDISLPEPALLDCHHRIAEVLHASGMSEEIDRRMQEWDDMRDYQDGCLKADGTTDVGRVLTAGLWASGVY